MLDAAAAREVSSEADDDNIAYGGSTATASRRRRRRDDRERAAGSRALGTVARIVWPDGTFTRIAIPALVRRTGNADAVDGAASAGTRIVLLPGAQPSGSRYGPGRREFARHGLPV